MLKIGDKVIIRKFDTRPEHWNNLGKMEKWMGQTVTIRSFTKDGYIHVEEDIYENYGGGWFWSESDFILKDSIRYKLEAQCLE